MRFSITIDQFEGPLDLMLHLIKEHKLDLFNLDIQELTKQYLTFLNQMKQQNLEIASEYLSELASLIEYKSKKILPTEVLNIEEEYQEDPKERLVRRLLEYKKYQDVSKQLLLQFEKRQQCLSKPVSEITQVWIDEKKQEVTGDAYQLIKAMNQVLHRYRLENPRQSIITKKEISFEKRYQQIENRYSQLNKQFTFENLCEDCESIDEIVMSFLVLLEYVRISKVFVSSINDKIYIEKNR